MKNKIILVVATAAVLVIAFFVSSKLYQKSEKGRIGSLSQAQNTLFVRDYAPKMGPENAKVTLVEFLDPECETCRLFYPYVKNLMKEFDGDIRLVIRYAPFHPNSKFAVKILEAAKKQGKYWEALEIFFINQPDWADHHHPKPELLWNYLPESGVDVEKVRIDMNDPTIDEIIRQDIEDGHKLGVRRTPSFFVNGKPLENFGIEPLRELIRSELLNQE